MTGGKLRWLQTYKGGDRMTCNIVTLIIYYIQAGPAELRSEVGNCLGRQAYWGSKLCQGKKKRKEKRKNWGK